MKVLIAEDEPVIALGLAQRLRELGHEPLGPAADGEQAGRPGESNQARRLPLRHRAAGPDRARRGRPARARGAPAAGRGHHGSHRPCTRRPVRSQDGVSAYLTKPIDERELDAALKLAAARQAELDAAHRALEDRKLVERAKGLLDDGAPALGARGTSTAPARRAPPQPEACGSRAARRRAAEPARTAFLVESPLCASRARAGLPAAGRPSKRSCTAGPPPRPATRSTAGLCDLGVRNLARLQSASPSSRPAAQRRPRASQTTGTR